MIKFKIMEILREKDLIFELDNQLFIVNPQVKKEKNGAAFILTKFNSDFNFDRIFSLPGEYNIGSVFFYSFLEKENLVYYFESEEGKILLGEKFSDEILKRLKDYTDDLDGLIFVGNEIKLDFFKKIGAKNIFLFKEINLSGFEKVKGKKFKINLKRSNNKIYILNE